MIDSFILIQTEEEEEDGKTSEREGHFAFQKIENVSNNPLLRLLERPSNASIIFDCILILSLVSFSYTFTFTLKKKKAEERKEEEAKKETRQSK